MADDDDKAPAVAAPVSENDTMKMLLKVTETLEGSVSKLADSISKLLGEAIGDSVKKGADKAKEHLSDLGANAATTIGKGLGEIPGLFSETGKKAWDRFNNSFTASVAELGLGIDVNLDLATTELAEITNAVTSAYKSWASPKIILEVAGFAAAKNALDMVADQMSGLVKIQKNLVDYSKHATDAFGGTWHAMVAGVVDNQGKVSTATRELTEGTEQYSEQVLGLVSDYGLSATASKDYADKAGALNITLGSLARFTASTGSSADASAKKMSGLSAVWLAANSTGLEFADVLGYAAKMTRELGIADGDAIQKTEMFSRAAAGTRLSIKEVSDAAMGGADKFKMYGDNLQSSTGLFKAFVGSLKDNEQALAKPLFEKVTSGLTGMSAGLKAYLGLTTSIGTGGGGAMGGILEVETAFETGEGIEKVMDALKQSVESMSGSPLLTKEQAIATGQQQTYGKQREFLGSQLQMSDPAEINRTINMMVKGDLTGFKQLVAPEAGGKGAGFNAGLAQQRATVEAGGPLQQGLNRAEGKLDRARVEVGNQILEASTSFKGVGKIFEDLTNKLLGIMEKRKPPSTERQGRDIEGSINFDRKDHTRDGPLNSITSASALLKTAAAAPLEPRAASSAIAGRLGESPAEAVASAGHSTLLTGAQPSLVYKVPGQEPAGTAAEPPFNVGEPPSASYGARFLLEQIRGPGRPTSTPEGTVAPAVLDAAAAATASPGAPQPIDKKESNSPIKKDIELSFKMHIDDKTGMVDFTPYIRKVIDERIGPHRE